MDIKNKNKKNNLNSANYYYFCYYELVTSTYFSLFLRCVFLFFCSMFHSPTSPLTYFKLFQPYLIFPKPLSSLHFLFPILIIMSLIRNAIFIVQSKAPSLHEYECFYVKASADNTLMISFKLFWAHTNTRHLLLLQCKMSKGISTVNFIDNGVTLPIHCLK